LIRSCVFLVLSAEPALPYFRFGFGVGDSGCEYCFHLQTIMTSLRPESLMETPRFFQRFDLDLASAAEMPRPGRFTFGPFQLDVEKHTLSRGTAALQLPPKCFELLCILVRSNGQLLDKDHLMHQLWPDTYVEEANLSNLVALLRKALGDSPSNSQYVQTVPKLGYRFKADVSKERKDAAVIEAETVSQPVLRIIVFPFRVKGDRPDLAHSATACRNRFQVLSLN
jgi:DNA-binding winged helix-turn-helix (wHTH) protein